MTPFGGYLTSSPAAIVDGAGRERVAMVGGDGGLYLVSVGAAEMDGLLRVVTDPGLFPTFTPDVHDYVSRCDASEPVEISIAAPVGTTVSVDGKPARSGRFTTAVTRDVTQRFDLVVDGLATTNPYHVRCLPVDFPTWTVERSGPTQAEYYALGGAFARYVFIVDSNGVPMWWTTTPEPAVFAQLLPDGRFGWITRSGTAVDVPLAVVPSRIPHRCRASAWSTTTICCRSGTATTSWSSTAPCRTSISACGVRRSRPARCSIT